MSTELQLWNYVEEGRSSASTWVCLGCRLRRVWLFVLLFIWAEPRGGGHSARVRGGRHWKEVESRETEDISLELVSAGRGRAPFQLAWQLYQGMCVTGGLGGAMHRASAQRQSNVISPMDWGVVRPCFTTLSLSSVALLFAIVVDHKSQSPHCACLCGQYLTEVL